MNSKIIRIIGLAATVIGLGANLINDWADEQKMNEQIDKKVNEALAKRDAMRRSPKTRTLLFYGG